MKYQFSTCSYDLDIETSTNISFIIHLHQVLTNVNMFQARLIRFKLSFDRGATYVFPLMFLLFNVGYWTVYLVIMPHYIQFGKEP